MKPHTSPTPKGAYPPPLLLTFVEAGALLGVSHRTVRRLVYDGELTSVNVRGARRVAIESVYRYRDRLLQGVGALGARS